MTFASNDDDNRYCADSSKYMEQSAAARIGLMVFRFLAPDSHRTGGSAGLATRELSGGFVGGTSGDHVQAFPTLRCFLRTDYHLHDAALDRGALFVLASSIGRLD